LGYPLISQQIQEKRKLRKLYESIEMNKYLNDSDSDFETFGSVDSDNLDAYEGIYKQRLR
jgi:hypothetical protein